MGNAKAMCEGPLRDPQGAAPDCAWLDQVGAFLELLNCGAALLTTAGRIVRTNARLAQLLHRNPEDLLDRTLRELYSTAEDRRHVEEVLAGFPAPGEEESYVPLPGGQRLPVLLSWHAAAPPGGTATHMLLTVTDISRQKKTEQRAKSQYEAVIQLSDNMLAEALEWKQRSQRLRQKLSDAHMDSIYMLAVASEAKDADTGLHVRRIQFASQALALAAGVDPQEAEMIGISAILHDVGKLLVPDEILKKPAALTDEERRTMELHTIAGETILPDKPFFRTARQIARNHHENWDGSGYPDSLRGTAIPLAARIVHIADVYDALVSERVYKKSISPNDAAGQIAESTGRQFDPDLVPHFLRLHEKGVLADLWEQLASAANVDDWSLVQLPENCAG